MGSCILNYTRNQFCGGRKPECPEETLEVRLGSSETRSTYNFVVEVEGVIDIHYASLTSQGVQHRVFYRDGHPSRYQPRPTGLNFGEQTGTGVFPLVIAVPPIETHHHFSFLCFHSRWRFRFSPFPSSIPTEKSQKIFLLSLKIFCEIMCTCLVFGEMLGSFADLHIW